MKSASVPGYRDVRVSHQKVVKCECEGRLRIAGILTSSDDRLSRQTLNECE